MTNCFPKITVVTVCYNAVHDIEKTLLSVINQTYENVEYIVIDGGSSDGSVNVLKKYENHITFWNSEKDKGVYDAMNKGIHLASGEWINFMNAGDVFSNSDVLKNISRHLEKKYDVIYGDYRINKRGNTFVVKSDKLAISDKSSPAMGFNHQASFVRSEVAKRYPFNLRYKLAADFDMMKTIYKTGGKFLATGIVVVDYDLGGLSNKNIFLHRYECLQIISPNNKIGNWTKAFLHFVRMKIQTIAANIIQSTCPSLLGLYYRSVKEFSIENNKIDYNDT